MATAAPAIRPPFPRRGRPPQRAARTIRGQAKPTLTRLPSSETGEESRAVALDMDVAVPLHKEKSVQVLASPPMANARALLLRSEAPSWKLGTWRCVATRAMGLRPVAPVINRHGACSCMRCSRCRVRPPPASPERSNPPLSARALPCASMRPPRPPTWTGAATPSAVDDQCATIDAPGRPGRRARACPVATVALEPELAACDLHAAPEILPRPTARRVQVTAMAMPPASLTCPTHADAASAQDGQGDGQRAADAQSDLAGRRWSRPRARSRRRGSAFPVNWTPCRRKTWSWRAERDRSPPTKGGHLPGR